MLFLSLLFSNLFIFKILIAYSLGRLSKKLRVRYYIQERYDQKLKKADSLNQFLKQHIGKENNLLWYLLLIPILGEIWFLIVLFTSNQAKKLDVITDSIYVEETNLFTLRYNKFKLTCFALSCLVYNYFLLKLVYFQDLTTDVMFGRYYLQCAVVFFGLFCFFTIWRLGSNVIEDTQVKAKQLKQCEG